MEIFETFADALASTECVTVDELEPAGLSISGTIMDDGSWRYFVVERDADDETVHEMAFQIRNGRSMGEYERWLRSMVLARSA